MDMTSKMTFLLLLFCQIYFVSAKLQLHPKFAVKPRVLDDYFTSSAVTDWTPSRQTVLYHLMRGITSLKIIVTIEDIPISDSRSIRMKFKYRCAPNVTEIVHEMQHPFQFTAPVNQICQSALPINIRTLYSNWTSNSTYQLSLSVSNTQASQVLFKDALIHNMRIRLEFFGPQWRLESNGLFLRNWDSVLPRSIPGLPKSHFLTQDAINVMKFEHRGYFDSPGGYNAKPFIRADVIRLIESASEFVKATIAIGAMLSINSEHCDGNPDNTIAFMSERLAYHHKYIGMKSIWLDLYDGMLHYSTHGLRSIANSIATGTNRLSTKCAGGSDDCTLDKICIWLEFTPHSYNAVTYSKREEIMEIRRTGNPYEAPAGHSTVAGSEVQCYSTIGQLRVHRSSLLVFARAASNFINCPIICPRMEKYTFYKNDAILQPDSNLEFTKHGAVSVHKSGAVLYFSQFVTHEDSGTYKCTAGKHRFTIKVKVVALPLFSIVGTELVGGELPPRIYARKGDDYTANCTVFYSNMQSVTITPEFYVVLDKTSRVWSKLTGAEFIERLKLFHSKAKITVSSTTFSTTLTLTVSNVPLPTAAFDLSHRFVCNASASADDMLRYGVSEYNVQSSSDVLIVPPPKAADFEAKMSSCCAKKCSGKKCVTQYSLKSEVLKRIRSVGLDVRGIFKIAGRSLITEEKKSVTYDTNSSSLKYQTDKVFIEMTDVEKQSFLSLVPVFEYFLPNESRSIISTKTSLTLTNGNNQSGAVLCDKDPSCYYSTESDKSLTESMRIGAKFSKVKDELTTDEEEATFEEMYGILKQSMGKSIIHPCYLLITTCIFILCAVQRH